MTIGGRKLNPEDTTGWGIVRQHHPPSMQRGHFAHDGKPDTGATARGILPKRIENSFSLVVPDSTSDVGDVHRWRAIRDADSHVGALGVAHRVVDEIADRN